MLGAFVSSPVHGPRSTSAARPATRPRPADAILRLQRTAGNAAVGRVLQRACASREPGEIERSRTGKGVLIDDVRLGPNALLVSDFGVGRSEVKDETKRDADLTSWIADFERDPSSYKLSVLGLDDCRGPAPVREKLRKARAESVRDLLGPKARQRVAVADGAPLEDYAADNLSAAGRAKNRGAVVMFEQSMQMPPARITVLKPKAPPRPTVDCDDDQAAQLAVAHTIAIAMVEKALKPVTGGDANRVNAIMRKYFNDDSDHTRTAVYRGLRRILAGLNTDFKYECDEAHPRFSASVSWLWRRVRVHKNAFYQSRPGVTIHPPPEYNLAELIVHECSHKFDSTDDEAYCDLNGCQLSPGQAINNADSYSRFAHDVFVAGP